MISNQLMSKVNLLFSHLQHSSIFSFSIYLYLVELDLSCSLHTSFDHAVSLSTSFLSVIPSPSSYPNFQLIPLPSERCWTAREPPVTEAGRDRWSGGILECRQGWEESEQKREDSAVWWHRHQELSKTDREAVRQGQPTGSTHIQTRTGAQWTLRWPPLPHPPNSQASPFTKLSMLSLKPHVSLHVSFLCFVPILSSILSSSPFSGWLGAVRSLTPFTSEASPWSEVPLFPPAKPSSTEVIRSPCSPGLSLLSWLPHTQTQTHTNTHRCSLRRRKRQDSPRGESLLVV